MDIGEPTVRIAEHATLGPVRIEIHQPRFAPKPSFFERIFEPVQAPAAALPQVETPVVEMPDELQNMILRELRQANVALAAIHAHLTRPSLWRRLILWVKHVVFSR